MARMLPLFLAVFALVLGGCGPQGPMNQTVVAGPAVEEAPATSAQPVPEVLAYDGEAAQDGESVPDLARASGGLFGSFKGFGNLGDLSKKITQGVQKQVVQNDPEVMSAIERMTIMLGPDRLGGQDGTFNQNDIPAIRDRLLQTPEVRQQMWEGIQDGMREKVPPVLANRWLQGRGLFANKALSEGWSQARPIARAQIEGELNAGMTKEFVSPAGPYQPDMTPRSGLTYSGLRQFEQDAKTIQAFGKKWKQDLSLPNGPSVTSMQQMAQGQTPSGAMPRAQAESSFPQRMASSGLSAPNTYASAPVSSCTQSYGNGGGSYSGSPTRSVSSSPSRSYSSGRTRRGVFGGGGLFRRR